MWKEEFRIDAAFEIENSTSIYSGLLRFADLNIVAPNTTYPMFIVAPRSGEIVFASSCYALYFAGSNSGIR